MKFKKTAMTMLVTGTLTMFCQGEESAIKFGFKERLPDSGMIKNKGSIKFSASVKSKSKSSSTCFAASDNGPGFIIGTKDHNYIEIKAKPEVKKLFSGGFNIKLGYTPTANLSSQPKNSVLVLLAKYDHGLQARSFTLFTGPSGNVTFVVSGDGKKTVSCSRLLIAPGKRVEFEARFIPGEMIALYQNGKKMAGKKIAFSQVYQSDQPLTIGARMFKGKNPINFGVGVIDSLEITPVAGDAKVKKKR